MIKLLAKVRLLALIKNIFVDFLTFQRSLYQRYWLYHLNSYRLPSPLDPDFIVVKIKHQAHLLEKCTKNSHRPGAGEERSVYLRQLLKLAENSGIDEHEILDWANGVLSKYERWLVEKKPIVELGEPKHADGSHSRFVTRSVRFWKPEKVSIDLINDCIRAAQEAPASCNRQAFKVAVKLNDGEIFFGEANNKSMFSKAPARAFIFVDHRCYSELYSPAIDVGMFLQNFVLRAKELGLSTCCCYGSEHLDPEQDMARMTFGLPDHYYCYVSVLIGYGDEVPQRPPRRDLSKIGIFR